MTQKPAISLLELHSIAAGTFAADKMVKKSPVELMYAGTVQPGKYMILVGGGTAEVEEAHREGLLAVGSETLDEVFLPHAHPQVVEALEGARRFGDYDSLVVLETSTAAGVLRAVDAAVKGTNAKVSEIRLANGLGGRGVAMLTGELFDVESAAEIATQALAGRPVKLCQSVVSRIHHQLADRVGESTRFYPPEEDRLGV